MAVPWKLTSFPKLIQLHQFSYHKKQLFSNNNATEGTLAMVSDKLF